MLWSFLHIFGDFFFNNVISYTPEINSQKTGTGHIWSELLANPYRNLFFFHSGIKILEKMCSWDTDNLLRQTGSRHMTELKKGDMVQLTLIILQAEKFLTKIDRCTDEPRKRHGDVKKFIQYSTYKFHWLSILIWLSNCKMFIFNKFMEYKTFNKKMSIIQNIFLIKSLLVSQQYPFSSTTDQIFNFNKNLTQIFK